MKAAVIAAPHQVEIREVERPIPGPGEALIRVEAVGVCGSDLHAYEGTQPFFRYPQIGGHEVVGTVEQIVPGPTAEIPGRAQPRQPHEGARVVLDPSLPCGRCYPCRRGRYNCCENMRVLGVHEPGAFAEYLVAPVGCLHRVAPAISTDAAVMIEPLSIGVQATNRARVTADDTVLVIGGGTIGLSVLLAAGARGARVAVSDLSPGRLELARELGAEATVNPAEQDVRDTLTEVFGPAGPAVVVEAVGRPETVRTALDLVAASGRVVLLGLVSADLSVPGSWLVKKELDFLGSRLHGGTIPQAVAMVEFGEVAPERLVSHHFSLERVEHAFELMLHEPDTTMKVILTP